MSAWDAVIGQTVVHGLQRVAKEGNPTHAWLFIGPPGSGRSVLASAFAAALQCENNGCGACAQCRDVRQGTHPDVAHVATEGLTIKINQVRDLVSRAALRPSRGRWQVILVEDADRLSEEAADALLLSIEEPPERTVWMLCAPTAEDIAPTIRSRCRVVSLRTPPYSDIAAHLVAKQAVARDVADFAARAALGHVGRARALATDDDARSRRDEIVRLPFSLDEVHTCLQAAAAVVEAAKQDADRRCEALDESETEDLKKALGAGTVGRKPRNLDASLKELAREQKLRRTRAQRDSIDRALVDIMALYRDVLMLQLGVATELINDEMRPSLARLAESSTAELTLARIEAVTQAREALQANAAPLLTLEAMALKLRNP